MKMQTESRLRKEIIVLLYMFVIGLIISGLTAFPIHTELAIAHDLILYFELDNSFTRWIDTVFHGVDYTDRVYPFIGYGTDWLAFAHLILAVLFLGIIKDPVRNIWVIQFGLIACAGVFPLALIAGEVRDIPFFWRLLDCSFGLFGGVLLWICYRKVLRLADRGQGGRLYSLGGDGQ